MGFDLFYPPMAGSVDPEALLTGTRISGSRLYHSKYCNWERYVQYIKLIANLSMSSWIVNIKYQMYTLRFTSKQLYLYTVEAFSLCLSHRITWISGVLSRLFLNTLKYTWTTLVQLRSTLLTPTPHHHTVKWRRQYQGVSFTSLCRWGGGGVEGC